MPRMARVVVAGIPHHITQRGNRREDVFFCDDDRQRYLQLLLEYSAKHELETLAYCLITNHVHLVCVPAREESLSLVSKPLDMRYAQHVNWTHGISGRLWQGRFYSCVLDEDHLWASDPLCGAESGSGANSEESGELCMEQCSGALRSTQRSSFIAFTERVPRRAIEMVLMAGGRGR